jgi:hypothetical protein
MHLVAVEGAPLGDGQGPVVSELAGTHDSVRSVCADVVRLCDHHLRVLITIPVLEPNHALHVLVVIRLLPLLEMDVERGPEIRVGTETPAKDNDLLLLDKSPVRTPQPPVREESQPFHSVVDGIPLEVCSWLPRRHRPAP